MKHLMLGVQIIVETLNLKINYFHVAIWQTTFVRQRIVLKCMLNVQQDNFFLIQPIKSLFSGVFVTVAVIPG